MNKTERTKHLRGYALGFFVFVVFMPALIYNISRIADPVFRIPIFGARLLNLLVSIPLFITGVVFVVWSNIDLFRKGKGGPVEAFGVAVSPRTKKLVVTGPYRYTRNPMVFGMNSIYMSIAVFLNSLVTLIFFFVFLSAVVAFLKLSEEKRLLRDFGEEYLEYRKRVPLLIPRPSKCMDNSHHGLFPGN